MTTIVTIDNAGRIVVPKALRDELRLSPGDKLSLETDSERLTLGPVRSTSAMRRQNGVWVFRSGRSISAEETSQALGRLIKPATLAVTALKGVLGKPMKPASKKDMNRAIRRGAGR